MVDAELALMREALRDPLNERFQLISEDTIPLYPATTVYREIMSAPGSHVTACDAHGRNTVDFPGVRSLQLRLISSLCCMLNMTMRLQRSCQCHIYLPVAPVLLSCSDYDIMCNIMLD